MSHLPKESAPSVHAWALEPGSLASALTHCVALSKSPDLSEPLSLNPSTGNRYWVAGMIGELTHVSSGPGTQ